MRKAQKKQAEEFVQVLAQAHEEIQRVIETGELPVAQDLLGQCQEGAIRLGELIEKTEGEGFVTISLLELYCELVYHIYEELRSEEADASADSALSISTRLAEALDKIEYSIKHDIKVKLEIAFLPYKASMWDSLESVWMAADADENCEAYVVPIPYYDRRPGGALGSFHYEGSKFPKEVPITHYDSYDMEQRRPDIIYIHNPYDEGNMVTSVDPRFYSYELKKYTDMLVYIPYYSTSGVMSEGQKYLSAYYHVDYIIMQSEKLRGYFAENIPQEKLIALGSPKFDKIVRLCNNPPEPLQEWKERMEGRKVYFYNTSIGGMLADTEAFLKKMRYVFECFEKYGKACLVWRPHPLLESTMESMRPYYKPEYDEIKQMFYDKKLGIYDTTPDITNTIAQCDAYIGDSGSSVVSLFGVAGKPIFILDNQIHTEPKEDDWRGEVIQGFPLYGNHRWFITQGNKLYYSDKGDYRYRYHSELAEYRMLYYNQVMSVGGVDCVCPINAQDILVLEQGEIKKKIILDRRLEHAGAFRGAVSSGRYLILIPDQYPAIVRYDTVTDEITYYEDYLDVNISIVNGQRKMGGYAVLGEYLFLASPSDNRVVALHISSGEMQVLTTNASDSTGCMLLQSDGEELWFLPFERKPIVRWNPFTGEKQEYGDYPEGLECDGMLRGMSREERLWDYAIFKGEYVYLPPRWANTYVRLNKHTGKMEQWMPSVQVPKSMKNEYFKAWSQSVFYSGMWRGEELEDAMFSYFDRRFYKLDVETGAYEEIQIDFDIEELRQNETGFCEDTEWSQYSCYENAFNSLRSFLQGDAVGRAFRKEKQLEVYGRIAANIDGSCGDKVHELICSKVDR